MNGYDKESTSKELGRNDNNGADERPFKVGDVGPIQSQTSNTPHTKKVHRSGVSAETVTSSGQTVE